MTNGKLPPLLYHVETSGTVDVLRTNRFLTEAETKQIWLCEGVYPPTEQVAWEVKMGVPGETFPLATTTYDRFLTRKDCQIRVPLHGMWNPRLQPFGSSLYPEFVYYGDSLQRIRYDSSHITHPAFVGNISDHVGLILHCVYVEGFPRKWYGAEKRVKPRNLTEYLSLQILHSLIEHGLPPSGNIASRKAWLKTFIALYNEHTATMWRAFNAVASAEGLNILAIRGDCNVTPDVHTRLVREAWQTIRTAETAKTRLEKFLSAKDYGWAMLSEPTPSIVEELVQWADTGSTLETVVRAQIRDELDQEYPELPVSL